MTAAWEAEAPGPVQRGLLSAATIPHSIELNVQQLGRLTEFYSRVLGLEVLDQGDRRTELGFGGRPLVVLLASEAPRRRDVCGLYHFALRYSGRSALRRAIDVLDRWSWPHSPTDHVMTKTTYLRDPEGNMVELYCESPEDGWFGFVGGRFRARWRDGRWSNGVEPLDLRVLDVPERTYLSTPGPAESDVILGHFHLHVRDLDATRAFYHGVLGFDDMGWDRDLGLGMLSTGAYHHHLGYNTWLGTGIQPRRSDTSGLGRLVFSLPSLSEFEALKFRLTSAGYGVALATGLLRTTDPNGIEIVFRWR